MCSIWGNVSVPAGRRGFGSEFGRWITTGRADALAEGLRVVAAAGLLLPLLHAAATVASTLPAKTPRREMGRGACRRFTRGAYNAAPHQPARDPTTHASTLPRAVTLRCRTGASPSCAEAFVRDQVDWVRRWAPDRAEQLDES